MEDVTPEDIIAGAMAAGDQLTALMRDVWAPMAQDMQAVMIHNNIEPETRSRIVSGIVLIHYSTAVAGSSE